MKKPGKVLIFILLAFILGAFAGAAVWAVLKVMSIGIYLLWTFLPDRMGCEGTLIYNLIVCLAGGLVIGIWQRRYGILPDELFQVMEKIKAEGAYPYNNLHIIAVSALLPLVFGGALGPEAGLTGLIAGLCCFVGDRLKYKGDEVAALMETGTAAVLGVVFNAPFFGIIDNLEPDGKKEKYRKKLVSKKTRIVIYVSGVAGAMLAMAGLGKLFGGGTGLPRFDVHHGTGLEQWKWFLPLLMVGVLFGFLYLSINKVTAMIGNRLIKYRIVSCIIPGLMVALAGYYLPLTMFSGEHEMGTLMNQWQTYSITILILTGIGKIFLVNICVNLGWRGGNVFPLIFAGVSIGYAMASILAIDGAFAVAVVAASLYAYIMRKPLTVVAVLLLCFPITYIIPLLLASFAASKIPIPKSFLVEED